MCRIWLPYLAAVALALAGDSLLYSKVATGNRWIDETWSYKPTAHLILQHVIMVGHFHYAQLNTAFWSLVYEMRISILYPILFWLSLRVRARVLLPLLFLVSMVMGAYPSHQRTEDFGYDVLYASFFVVGIFLQRSMPQISRWFQRRSVGELGILVFLALLCFDGPGAFPEATGDRWQGLSIFLRDWVTLAGATGILAFAINLNGFRHFLHSAPLLRLGKISYSIYLVHGTVLFVFIRLFYGNPHFGWLLPVYLILTYVIAEGMHAGVEQPAIVLGRWLGGGTQGVDSSLRQEQSSVRAD